MANADVAILKTYRAETLDKCITDCCAEKFGEEGSFIWKLSAWMLFWDYETHPGIAVNISKIILNVIE